jgi:hypothetical protein
MSDRSPCHQHQIHLKVLDFGDQDDETHLDLDLDAYEVFNSSGLNLYEMA